MGNGAADAAAGSILSMFNFRSYNPPLFLDPTTGEPVSPSWWAANKPS